MTNVPREADFQVSLQTVLSSAEEHRSCVDELTEYAFGQTRERRATIAVIFGDGSEIEMPIGKFLVHAVIMTPIVRFGTASEMITKDYFVGDVNAHSISRKIDWVIGRLRGVADPTEVSLCVAEVLRDLSDISTKANDQIGNTVNIYSILKAADANPELDALLNLSIPDGMQFHEIEEFIDHKLRRLVKILSEEDTCLRDMLLCGSAVNLKQLGQTLMNVSLKPDLFGKVIPEPINTSFLRGMRGVEDYFINAIGARKALITNYKQVKISGYLARKLALLVVDTDMDHSVDDCGTRGTVAVHIDGGKTLEKIVGRHIVEDGTLRLVREGDNLKGRTVNLRSPITCSAPNGICRTCYGRSLADLNRDLHVGILGILILSSQLTQLLLSSKHLLQTKSEKIDWPEAMFDALTVDRDQLVPTGAVESVFVNREDVHEDDDTGEPCVRRFSFRINNEPEVRDIHPPVPLLLSEDARRAVEESDSDVIELSLSQSPFYYSMENEELSRSLRMISELIEKNEHLGLGNDIGGILNRFLALINESSISIQSVHIEVILRELVRRPEDLIARPDFSNGLHEDYVVLRLPEAIIQSKSLSTSLAFQEIRRQLHSPDTFRKRAKGMLDGLFVYVEE